MAYKNCRKIKEQKNEKNIYKVICEQGVYLIKTNEHQQPCLAKIQDL